MSLNEATVRGMLESALGGPLPDDARVAWTNTAAWAIYDWRGDDCEVSFAGRITPTALRRIFGYVFGTLNCVRCTAHVDERNSRMRALMPRLGFRHEGTRRSAYDGADVLMFGMLKQECTWYGNSQAESAEAA